MHMLPYDYKIHCSEYYAQCISTTTLWQLSHLNRKYIDDDDDKFPSLSLRALFFSPFVYIVNSRTLELGGRTACVFHRSIDKKKENESNFFVFGIRPRRKSTVQGRNLVKRTGQSAQSPDARASSCERVPTKSFAEGSTKAENVAAMYRYLATTICIVHRIIMVVTKLMSREL